MQQLFECLSKFRIEYGVDEWINTGIDVAQPCGDHESSVSRIPTQIEFDANGIENIASEEWNPAYQKHRWKMKR